MNITLNILLARAFVHDTKQDIHLLEREVLGLRQEKSKDAAADV